MPPGLCWRAIAAAWKRPDRADRRLADNLEEGEIVMRAIDYLRARLAEPGTMRSLIWVCLSVAGLDSGDTALTHYALTAGVLLGVASALLPERK